MGPNCPTGDGLEPDDGGWEWNNNLDRSRSVGILQTSKFLAPWLAAGYPAQTPVRFPAAA